MKKLRLELEILYKTTQPTAGTQKSYEALEALISMLHKLTIDVDKKHNNNNFNFFNNSQEAKTFYDIAFPKGSSTPEINDDLAAAVGQKLLVALENFSAWKHLAGPVFFAQKFIPGNPIETAKKDLKERVEHYHQIDKEWVMLIAFSKISNKLGQLSRLPENTSPKEVKAKYDEIALLLVEANFQFAHEQTPGIQAVACGVLLPQILDCQNTLVNKFAIPLQDLESIPIALPQASDSGKFEAHLLDYCQRLEANIDRYFDKKKDIKPEKASLLKFLRGDIQGILKDIESGKTFLADGCLVVYNAVADAVSKHHQIAAGKSTSNDLLNNALSEVKALSSHYTVSMSVRGLTLTQEHKAQPGSSPKVEPKESVSPVASRK